MDANAKTTDRRLSYYQREIIRITRCSPEAAASIEAAMRDQSNDGCLDSWSAARFKRAALRLNDAQGNQP